MTEAALDAAFGSATTQRGLTRLRAAVRATRPVPAPARRDREYLRSVFAAELAGGARA